MSALLSSVFVIIVQLLTIVQKVMFAGNAVLFALAEAVVDFHQSQRAYNWQGCFYVTVNTNLSNND